MKGCKCRFLSAAMLLTASFVSVALLPIHAHSQANFYEGKTITLIAFTAPGGSGDLRVKAAVPFLKKHIPEIPRS
jgi:tripartite-type tricarboxylate transporter receptor subunit TctC